MDRRLTRWRAGEEELDQDTNNVHITKGTRVDAQGSWGGKEEDGRGAEDWAGIVDDAVRQPREHIEDGMLVR